MSDCGNTYCIFVSQQKYKILGICPQKPAYTSIDCFTMQKFDDRREVLWRDEGNHWMNRFIVWTGR
jgi:hypothetical protein